MGERRNVTFLRTAGLLLVSLGWALLLAFTGSPEVILFTAPVFLLAAPLAFGRYPGEAIIAAVSAPAHRRFRTVPLISVQGREVSFTELFMAGTVSGRGPPSVFC